MYYSAHTGARGGWRDHILTIFSEFRQHNWLPAAVGAIMVSWVALIVMGLQQTILDPPRVPDKTQVGQTDRPLNVTTAAAVTSSSLASSSGGNSTGPTQDMSMIAQPSQQLANIPNVVEETTEVIGGRGGDEPVNPVIPPLEEVVDPLLTNPMNDDGDIVIDPAPLPILGVELPTIEVELSALL